MADRAALKPSPITPEDAERFIRGRRSVDQFLDDVPDPQWARNAIEVARWAPNHHLTQPWRFYLLGEQTKMAIVDLNARLVSARKGDEVAAAKRERWQNVPGWIAVNCRIEEDETTAREDYAACACAIQNLTLYLHSAGIGCKWVSGEATRVPELLEILGVDGNEEYNVGLIWYGYPKRRPRTQRKPLDEVLFTRP